MTTLFRSKYYVPDILNSNFVFSIDFLIIPVPKKKLKRELLRHFLHRFQSLLLAQLRPPTYTRVTKGMFDSHKKGDLKCKKCKISHL
jgi:hypothetical protein